MPPLDSLVGTTCMCIIALTVADICVGLTNPYFVLFVSGRGELQTILQHESIVLFVVKTHYVKNYVTVGKR